MVPKAAPSPMVALVGDASVTVNVSSASSRASFAIGTSIVREAKPGGKVSVPDAAV